ncbi:MAG TPA: hypothetical protein VGD86_05345 [Devosia sp.]|jgi:hypothetical protein
MTFKYSVTLPVSGGNKLKRFTDWAGSHLPALDYVLPPQTPIKTETMTIRLRSVEDRARVLETLAKVPLPREAGI